MLKLEGIIVFFKIIQNNQSTSWISPPKLGEKTVYIFI